MKKELSVPYSPPKILFPLLSYTQFFIVVKVFSFCLILLMLSYPKPPFE